MRDFSKNTARWISGLTKDQFDELIKVFLKEYWKVDLVSLTDGTNDGGIDIKIFQNKLNKRIPIQVTIDKSVYKKLDKDLKKISYLISEFQYSETFYFYYSGGASEKKVIELEEYARREYSIELKIFDNKLISTHLDKPEYYLSRAKLNDILGDYFQPESSYADESDKLYFDLMSYSPNTLEIKEKFIYSFILNELSKVPKDGIGKKDISTKIEKHFNTQLSDAYCNKVLESLLTSKKIELVDVSENTVRLSEAEYASIKGIKDSAEILEREFLTSLQEVINSFDTKIELKLLVDKIYNIFQDNGNEVINEINEDYNFENGDNDSLKDFQEYLLQSLKNPGDFENIIIRIFEVCKENDFLNRISAGKLFKKLIDNSEYVAYNHRFEKDVYLDTPVLLNLFLVMIDTDYQYENYRFKVAKDLFDVIFEKKVKAKFHTTELYIQELADYLDNSIKLIPLEEMGIFETLGGTTNELIKYYIRSKDDGYFEGTYKELLEKQIGLSVGLSQKSSDRSYIKQFLTKLFKDNQIIVEEVFRYDTNWKTKKHYAKIAQILSSIYAREEVVRRPRSTKFDSLFFMHLYDKKYDFIDPTVLTWDNTFRKFRKEYQTEHPNLRFWHLYRPGKYLDHLSLMNFKISSETISNEILSLIETDNFEIARNIRRLSDILISIIDLKSAQGAKLSKGLADIRSHSIYEINKESTPDESIDKSEFTPIDKLVTDITDYYANGKGKHSFDDLKMSLTDNVFVEEILKIIKKEAYYFIEKKAFSTSYQDEINLLLEKSLADNSQ